MDYAHARHAGNAGDVLKHVALVALIEAMLGDPAPLTYVETHAGDGLYPLGSAGEWGDGVLRVWSARDGLLGRYAATVTASRPSAQERRAAPEAEVHEGDGIAALPPAAEGRALVLIDPPYTDKQQWTDAARALERIRGVPSVLWYPIKALTRPRALIAELVRLDVHGIAVELHWTPLRLRRERLNGAGLILAAAPKEAVASISAALPELGALLQTHGEWGAAQIGF